jgi:aspartyl-tRNA(Asn)/glutamyl-tRNA(Gln) amidotransferase subunit B
MEDGGLRCDANISVRRRGDPALGARTEIKNLNSFRAVQHALECEFARQSSLLAAGGAVATDTRLWDEHAGRTVPMRTKEESEDYRYFPEPDLPPLVISRDRLDRLRAGLPELPDARRARLASTYGLDEDDAEGVAGTPGVARFFEAVAASSGDPGAACRWIRGELTRRVSDAGLRMDAPPITPEALGHLIRMVAAGSVSVSAAKEILGRMVATGGAPDTIAAAEGLLQESGAAAIEALVENTLARHPDQVSQYRAGRRAVAGFLVGQVMKASGGRANPAMVDRIVRARLDSDPPAS